MAEKSPGSSPFWAPHVHADRRPALLARGRIVTALRSWFAGQNAAVAAVTVPLILVIPLVLAIISRHPVNGLLAMALGLAATGAGLPCLITTSAYTIDEDFTGAVDVVPELGDPPNVRITLEALSRLASRRAA